MARESFRGCLANSSCHKVCHKHLSTMAITLSSKQALLLTMSIASAVADIAAATLSARGVMELMGSAIALSPWNLTAASPASHECL